MRFHMTTSPRSSIGCVQNDFRAYGTLTQTVHLSYIKISTIPKQVELSLETRHLGLPSGASKTISKPMARSTQTMQLSCVKISTISKWSEIPHDHGHLGVPSGASKTIFEPMVRSAQTVHRSCVKLALYPNRPKRASN